MHEIITLQLGQQSNYLATHFWNTQESYFTYSPEQESLVNHDIHFRPGIGADGSETFTPRTIIYDLKGGFGTLKQINALYELQETAAPQALWNGPTVVQRQAAIEQSAYQQSLEEGLEPPPLTTESVRYWSDFNRVYFHPKSVIQLNEYELGSSLMPFEKWNLGEDLFNSLDKQHDILDCDLRPFVEEADHLQGIQLISSIDDAWGGFSARYMDRLVDEYGKNMVWVWGLEDEAGNTPRDKRLLKLSNTARSITEMTPQASLFIPMTIPSNSLPPYVRINRLSPWHMSAVLATALESMTLPLRLKVQDGLRESLDKTSAALNVNGNQNIAKLQMSLGTNSEPKQLNGDHRVAGFDTSAHIRDPRMSSQERRTLESVDVDEAPVSLDICLFPPDEPNRNIGSRMSKKLHIFGQAENFRGRDLSSTDLKDRIYGNERARRRVAGLPIIHKTKSPLPFPIIDSFPHIYYQAQPGVQSTSLPVRTSLSTDSSVASRIKSIGSIISRAIRVDERETLVNSLSSIADAYEEGWDSGSDEGDDD